MTFSYLLVYHRQTKPLNWQFVLMNCVGSSGAGVGSYSYIHFWCMRDCRPLNIFLPNWCRQRPAALDVTVISTLQPLTQSGAASEKRYALKLAEERKMSSTQYRTQRWKSVICSPCCGVAGRLEPRCSPTDLQNQQTSGSEAWYHPMQKQFVPAFVHLWGNATMWARRLPSHSAWTDGNILIYYIYIFCLFFCFYCFVLFCSSSLYLSYIVTPHNRLSNHKK